MQRIVGRCLAIVSTFVLFLSVGTFALAATTYSMPSNSGFKAWMDYRTITNRNSMQYKLQQDAETDANGLRVYNGRYMVAVGSYFHAPVGTYLDVELADGTMLNCVVGDAKQDRHTDAQNLQTANGNIVEFIVDINTLPSSVKSSGNVSCLTGFDGEVARVTVHTGQEDVSYQNARVTEKKAINLGDEDLYKVSYESETNLDTLYVEEEVFETLEDDTEVFVTYSVANIYLQ